MLIDDDQVVVRSALLPKILAEDGMVAPQQVVAPFSPKVLLGGAEGFALSVGWKALLPTPADVHDFGCRVAAVANVSAEERKGEPLVRGDETIHYRGSYELAVRDVMAVESEVFDIAVRHEPENGLDEHCDIELAPKDDSISKNKKSKARTGVIAQLFQVLRSPSEHICACDEDLREKLEKYRLPDFQATKVAEA